MSSIAITFLVIFISLAFISYFSKKYVGSVQVEHSYNEHYLLYYITFGNDCLPEVIDAVKQHCDLNRVSNSITDYNGVVEWTVASTDKMNTPSQYEAFIHKVLGCHLKVKSITRI
jgi:hypothetical protein